MIKQVISSKEVMGILGGQTTKAKARQILKTMEQHRFIKAITGKGKNILSISQDI